MKISNETKVGALAAVAITILILGYSFLRGKNLFTSSREFYAAYEKVPGLDISDPIELNGLQIGRVSNIYLKEDYSGLIMVRLSISSDIDIPKESEARLISSDLLGDKSIQLIFSDREEVSQSGDTLVGSIQGDLAEEIRAELEPITGRVVSMIGQIDTAINIISGIFGTKAQKNIDQSLVSVQASLENFQEISRKIDLLIDRESEAIDSILNNINSISSNIDQNEEEINNILRNFSTVSDSLNQLEYTEIFTSLESSVNKLATMVEKVEKGEGTLGLLLNDEALYENLEASSANLELLLRELQERPQKYVPPIIQIGGRKSKAD